MSKQRQRARGAQRQAAAARAKAAKRQAAAPKGGSVRVGEATSPQGTGAEPAARRGAAGSTAKRAPSGRRPAKAPVYRQRRFPPLPLWLKLALALGWLAVQVVVFLTVPSLGTRIALAIISLFALPLIVVLVRDPSRRTRR